MCTKKSFGDRTISIFEDDDIEEVKTFSSSVQNRVYVRISPYLEKKQFFEIHVIYHLLLYSSNLYGIHVRYHVRSLDILQYEVWLLSNRIDATTSALRACRDKFEQNCLL
ncbi:hypothetical protein NQ318_015941 [Aromia moschata]|uniref:Uncharacterized protein n=1 Tax=Aromia moschata TaxID=1265417 RepID=A0AAV8X6H5_9CUCU|nr:hypothetical protein NQ318_015941 [Aromia moschata]